MEAFSSVVAKIGCVDLLKLDCEGAEWEIFEAVEAWNRIRSVTLEYHLSAREGTTSETIRDRLRGLGFKAIELRPAPDGPWGFAHAEK